MTVKVSPGEIAALAYQVRQRLQPAQLPLEHWSVVDLMIWEYWQKARLDDKVRTWSIRKSGKRYAFKIPLSIARLLHEELQQLQLDIYSQSLLTQLDYALVNLPRHEMPGGQATNLIAG